MKSLPRERRLPETEIASKIESGSGAEPDPASTLQMQLDEALLLGKFQGAINTTLDPNDICAIAARVLFDHIPFLRIIFSLSEKFGKSTIVFSPAESDHADVSCTTDGLRRTDMEDPQKQRETLLLLSNGNFRFRRHTLELPEDIGCVEVFFDKEKLRSFSSMFLADVAQNLACALKNSLEYSKVKEMAMRDGLTGLFNRRAFDEILNIEGEQQRLRPLSLLLIDLDNFKQVNDTFGHSAGDEVLATFARVLRESCRGADLVARYGGEEFAVMLPNTTSAKALEIAQRLRVRFAATAFAFEGRYLKLTASIGIACTTGTSQVSITELVQRADNALYRAKNGGKNRACIFNGAQGSRMPRKDSNGNDSKPPIGETLAGQQTA